MGHAHKPRGCIARCKWRGAAESLNLEERETQYYEYSGAGEMSSCGSVINRSQRWPVCNWIHCALQYGAAAMKSKQALRAVMRASSSCVSRRTLPPALFYAFIVASMSQTTAVFARNYSVAKAPCQRALSHSSKEQFTKRFVLQRDKGV